MKKKLNCILLIDDDEATNFFNNIILEEIDCAHHIKIKQTARAALNYLVDSGQLNDRQNGLPFPDLIFLDINMPAMNGWEFLAKFDGIKDSLPKAPVIVMLSTSINPDDKLKADNTPHIAEFFNKPITPIMVTSIINKYFPV